MTKKILVFGVTLIPFWAISTDVLGENGRNSLDFLEYIVKEYFTELVFLIALLLIVGFLIIKFVRHKNTTNSKVYREIFEELIDEFQKDIKQLRQQFFTEPRKERDGYSVGYYLQIMKIRLSLIIIETFPNLFQSIPPNPADLSLALMDTWSHVADVLSEYQEKIAEEGYLDSATNRDSISQIQKEIQQLKREFVNKKLDETRIDLKNELKNIRERIKKFFRDTEQILRKKND